MNAITNTNPAPSAATQPGGTQSGSSSSMADAAMLGKDDFLKLLVSQLRHQDPMSPVDSKDFMGQMAQFTSVEQLANMSKAIDRMSTASQATQSVSLIGRNVTWMKQDGSTGEGVAQSVSFGTDGAIKIAVGEDEIAPSEIVSVR